jgi:hypothetical protein
MLSRSRKRLLRSPLLMLALVVALALRSVIPVGYMPEASEGGMHMALCPGMPMPDHADHSGPGSSHADSGVCLFAASALPPLPAGHGALVIPLQSQGSSTAPRASAARISELQRTQQARAPPVSQAV